MNKKQILQKLRNDEDYYGEFGNQYLSNSHIGKLLKDPLRAFEPSKPSPAFLVGGYFHTCILEPNKLDKAIDFVQKGGAITAIESKYNVTSKQLEALKVVADE